MNLKSLFSQLAPKYWRELARLFRNHKWERTDDGGVLIGFAKISGLYETYAPDGLGWQQDHNLMTTEGCNYMLSVVTGNTTGSTFYVAPFGANVAVVDTLTSGTFAGTQTELTTQYSETTRVTYVESVPAAKAMNNTASPATITAATANVLVYGIGLLNSSTKANSSTTNVLLSAANYASVRTLPTAGDTLGIKYTLTLANSA